jgi:beta-lactamase regulating signal transducer with metallopeptidase domain/nitrous oxidase accessory protein NosD
MDTVIQGINSAGKVFVDFSAVMLVQSSVLIFILILVDLLVCKRVRAVVRYSIWMLVLIKLVLPPSLYSPFGLGAVIPDAGRLTGSFNSAMPGPQQELAPSPSFLVVATSRETQPGRISSESGSLSTERIMAAGEDQIARLGTDSSTPVSASDPQGGSRLSEAPDAGSQKLSARLSWQGLALAVWLMVVMTLVLLLAQRAMFVRGLVRQASVADEPMRSLLAECCTRMGMRGWPAIRTSPNATSPAVCGLWRPVILVPQDLVRQLQPDQARAVLLHELAHIKRGDLWINLIQTLLQIAYFYNPLLWLANWRIRRVREQAVDEAVLVAMADKAERYTSTLVHMARLALARPALGLRLIGVVESKGALASRIRHILGRPFPTTARLGFSGVLIFVLMASVLLPLAASQDSREGSGPLAWQRTDRYVPPDPNGFFPDDPEGGKRLHALFDAVDKDQRSDEEILLTVRQGFRRTIDHKTLILAWIGNKYIWNKDPQNARAIEIMYHAVPWERHYAVYFGLSVVKEKSPNILRTLAEICLQGEEVGRITWGIGDQREPLLMYIRPHVQDTDPARREVAETLVRHFAGEVDFEKWKQQRELERKKVQFADQMPRLQQQLLTGDSGSRLKVFDTIQRNGIGALMDDAFLDAMEACAKDPDREVRNQVARIAGGRWVWGSQEQSPRAIALMCVLAADEDREVRYNAVYFGLSVVRQKDRPIVEQLVEMALKDHEPNLYGRIVWGLRGLKADQQGLLRQVLADRPGRMSLSQHDKASLHFLYKAILEIAPPIDWGLQEAAGMYPEDLFIVTVSGKEGAPSMGVDDLWREVKACLPSGLAAERIPHPNPAKTNLCLVGVRGKEAADGIKKAIEGHSLLRLGQVELLPPEIQLYLEETGRAIPPSKATVGGGVSNPFQVNPLQTLVDAAESGATVMVPKGTYVQPLRVTKPLTLRGVSTDECILELTANEPALSVDSMGKGQVTVENLTFRWQLATSDKGIERPFALHVKDTQAVVRHCRFVPLGNPKRSPVAVRIDGFSKATVEGCRFEGFEYVVCFGEGTQGTVQDCMIADCGHQGVINYANSTLTVQRNVITGSKFHAVRCTGGTLHVKDNLIANNRSCGVYLGNKDSTGTIQNNLFIGNATAVAGLYQSEYQVTNNVILDSMQAGIGLWDSCKVTMQDNILVGNPKAAVIYPKAGRNSNTLGRNTYWRNDAETENCEKAADSIAADPLFAEPNTGDYTCRSEAVRGQGLIDPKIIRTLWSRWKGKEIKGP